MRPDPEPGAGDQQPDLSADGVQRDPLHGFGTLVAVIRTTGSQAAGILIKTAVKNTPKNYYKNITTANKIVTIQRKNSLVKADF